MRSKRRGIIAVSVTIACVVFSRPAIAEQQDRGRRHDALRRAQQFLVDRGEGIDLESYLVYQFLERRYRAAHVDFDVATAEVEALEHGIEPFLRLNDGRVRIAAEDIALRSSRIDRFTLQALLCDHYPVQHDFLATLQEFVELPGYYLTHSLIAVQWLRENKCAAAGTEAVVHAEAKAVQRLIELCDTGKYADDRYVEAVAVLYYSGHEDAVQDTWIERILAAQQTDGGWRSFHTSVLAFWVLLEAGGVTEEVSERWIPE